MSMTIKNGMLFNGDKAVTFKATPNKSGSFIPDLIILHDTASGLTSKGPIDWLCNPVAKASAHFVLGREGDITQLAPTNIKTWHAGKSSYHGQPNVNNRAVGIEIVNPGWLTSKDGGKTATFSKGSPTWDAARYGIYQITDDAHPGRYYWMSYTVEQINAVIEMCRALVAAYPRIKDIQPHWYISPGRKVDVNPLFPLQRVRDAVFSNRGPVQEEVKTTEEVLAPNVPLAADEKDAANDYDAFATANLNLRPWPDSPNRFGVVKIQGEIDVERTSVSQKDGSTWFFVRVKPDQMASKEKGAAVDADGYMRGFVSSTYVKMVD